MGELDECMDMITKTGEKEHGRAGVLKVFGWGSTFSSPPTIGGPAVRYPYVVYLQLLYGTLTHETVAVRQKRLGGPDHGPRSAV
jgi:hypothetical protein